MKTCKALLKTATALGLAPTGAALNTIVLACSQLVIDRIDPIVEPGALGSAHVHQLVGGNSLNATMDYDPAAQSTCTSCTFADDFSNYWTPAMYYQARNGSYKRVKQLGVLFFETHNGGVKVYYFSNRAKVGPTGFPQGFRMRHGDPAGRGPEVRERFPNITHTCLDHASNRLGYRESPGFPARPCPAGILTTIWMPQCWDGKNLDSPDHASHVSPAERMIYNKPEIGSSVAVCPESHPVQVPQIVMETRWDTRDFNTDELWGWRGEGQQPFLWSTGDREGWSLHADYLFGWKGDSLQRALGTVCDGQSGLNNCAGLTEAKAEEANKCTKPPMVKDEYDGWVEEMPGGVQAWQ